QAPQTKIRITDSEIELRGTVAWNFRITVSEIIAEGYRRCISADEEIRDPLVLEFLGLKNEYAETDLEEALLRHLESFLLELGGEFAFIGRQRRLRIGGEWYRVDEVSRKRVAHFPVVNRSLAKIWLP